MTVPRLTPAQTVFLDRDGTINQPPTSGCYITDPADLRLMPGASEAIRTLNKNGATTVIVTNQRGLSLGLMNESDLDAIHSHLASLLATEGAYIDYIFFCPHALDSCSCRKPQPGLLLQAARDCPEVELEGAVIIGDSANDIGAGNASGITSIRLGPTDLGEPSPTAQASSLLEAVGLLTGEYPSGSSSTFLS